MKIIGPRAIVGPRRQTRIERLPLCSLRGEGVDVSPSERINGGRRASELRLGRPRNAKGRRLVLEPRGNGSSTRDRPCGHGLRLAPTSRPTRESWLNANRHGTRDLPEKLEASTRPRALLGAQTTPIVGPAHALGTRREELGASNTATKEDLRLDSSFAEFFLEMSSSVRVAMGES